MVPNISNERERFSLRLQQTLRNAHHSPDSPTELARDFNLRFAGRPITVHAARKWLVGEAIPTQDKMRTLAEWLGVPIEWLRFGGDERRANTPHSTGNFKSIDLRLMSDLQLLDDNHRRLVSEFVRILIRVHRQKMASSAVELGKMNDENN
ncbi:MAG: hypothetical protein JWQ21_3302 [Herminiimonas sp.]|nr:hypothetical protein [Herminiimonas sp.]